MLNALAWPSGRTLSHRKPLMSRSSSFVQRVSAAAHRHFHFVATSIGEALAPAAERGIGLGPATKLNGSMVLLALALATVAAPASAGEAWAVRVWSDGPYPSGPSDMCVGPTVYSENLGELGAAVDATYDSITGSSCWDTCRNPANVTGVTQTSQTTATVQIVSLCTGSTYEFAAVKVADPAQPVCDPGELGGNPCNLATGAKVQTIVDYEDPYGDLTLARTYNSQAPDPISPTFGPKWQSGFDKRASGFGPVQTAIRMRALPAYFWRPGGYAIVFKYDVTASTWKAARANRAVLTQRLTLDGNHDGWILAQPGNKREIYDAQGRLLREEDARGAFLTYAYDTKGRVSSVTDLRGRSLRFIRNTGGYVASAFLPDDREIKFQYASTLSRVFYPDATSNTWNDNPREDYLYEEPGKPQLLTGIVDAKGNRIATWDYDGSGRVILSTHGDAAATIDRLEIEYTDANTVTVRQPLGAVTELNFADINGSRRMVGADGPCPSCLGVDALEKTFDVNGWPDVVTGLDGVTVDYDYNAKGQLIQRTDAANDPTGARRTLQIDWHPTLDAPVESRVYDAAQTLVVKSMWTYNGRGQVATASGIDPETLATRTTTYAYCEAVDAAAPGSVCPLVGQLKSIDGPRSGADDTTTYEYRSADDLSGCATNGPCHRRGDLYRIVDSLGHPTLLERYDTAGRLKAIRDANNVVTGFSYDPRGRLAQRTAFGTDDTTSTDDATTTLTYDAAGQLTKATSADGTFVKFNYDAVRRLKGIEDSAGNTITYGLDDAGNRFSEEIRDTGGVLKATMTRLFDEFGKLETIADSSLNPTDFTYDPTGNVITVTDALGRVTTNDYDALGRLRESIENFNGIGAQRAVSQFGYDALDRLTSVVDPKGLTTGYDYDGLGNLALLTSPDTGTTRFAHDSGGNRIGQIDARGIETQYDYDAINRLTLIRSHPSQVGGGTLLAEFTYDAAPAACDASQSFGIGRLSGFVDPSGGTTYCHDQRGNVTRKVQRNLGGKDRSVSYTYTNADRLNSISYPSGMRVTYTRDASGQVNGVAARTSDTTTPVNLITGASYLPFGPMQRLVFGNGRVLDKNYDMDYGIESVADSQANGLALGYSLDEVGNVVGLSERQNGGATAARTVAYDGLDRLTRLANGATTVQGFTYDATGNRSQKVSGATANYVYAADSHRLTKVGTVTRGYDAAGNSTTIGTRTYRYDDRGRMASVSTGTTLTRSYGYNALGQRVAKIHPTTATSTIFYVYDEAGKLMGEYRPNGTLIREYIWLDDTLVAIRGTHAGQSFQYVLTDHLNTPRAVVLPSTNAIVWRWDLTTSAFGDHAAQNNPDGDTANYVFNLRYPGQYFDSESGLHYNYFRDYEPGTGRYVQSDPIGLMGGMSTFAYSESAPLNLTDPTGLSTDLANVLTREFLYTQKLSWCEKSAIVSSGLNITPVVGPTIAIAEFVTGEEVVPLAFASTVATTGGAAIALNAGRTTGIDQNRLAALERHNRNRAERTRIRNSLSEVKRGKQVLRAVGRATFIAGVAMEVPNFIENWGKCACPAE